MPAVRNLARRLDGHFGVTGKSKVSVEKINICEKITGQRGTEVGRCSRIELRQAFTSWASGDLVGRLDEEYAKSDVFTGLALYALLARAGFYELAISFHEEALGKLGSPRYARSLPTYWQALSRNWQRLDEFFSEPSVDGGREVREGQNSETWVIVGPGTTRVDLQALELESFSAVSLNTPIPEWLDDLGHLIDTKVIFVNNYVGRNVEIEGSPERLWAMDSDVLFVKNPKTYRRMARQDAWHGNRRRLQLSDVPSRGFLVGSPNMLPIALSTAKRLRIAEVHALGFDLYTGLQTSGWPRAAAEAFEMRGNFLDHDPWEQQSFLTHLLSQGAYRPDAGLLQALRLDHLELLRRVGGFPL